MSIVHFLNDFALLTCFHHIYLTHPDSGKEKELEKRFEFAFDRIYGIVRIIGNEKRKSTAQEIRNVHHESTKFEKHEKGPVFYYNPVFLRVFVLSCFRDKDLLLAFLL
jgi:hypothetical protein